MIPATALDAPTREAITEILYSALTPTESYRHLFADETKQERIRTFFKKRVDYIVKNHGLIFLSPNADGVLVAFMPDLPKLTPWVLIKEGLDLVFSYRLKTMKRMIQSVKGTGQMHTSEFDNCIILSVLAVHPQQQGKGIGAGLMREFLQHFPTQSIKLDTASAANEQFYERFGFTVAARGDCGVPVAMMVRT
jgi:predicted GNAT family N-acyltransferase